MIPDRREKRFYILGAVMLLLGLGYLLFSGLSRNSVYFLTVGEALDRGLKDTEQVRLFGRVGRQGLSFDAKDSTLEFNLADRDDPSRVLVVFYQGPVPDTFKPGVEVIVEGHAQGRAVFRAKTLMTKCPSKYRKAGSS